MGLGMLAGILPGIGMENGLANAGQSFQNPDNTTNLQGGIGSLLGLGLGGALGGTFGYKYSRHLLKQIDPEAYKELAKSSKKLKDIIPESGAIDTPGSSVLGTAAQDLERSTTDGRFSTPRPRSLTGSSTVNVDLPFGKSSRVDTTPAPKSAKMTLGKAVASKVNPEEAAKMAEHVANSSTTEKIKSYWAKTQEKVARNPKIAAAGGALLGGLLLQKVLSGMGDKESEQKAAMMQMYAQKDAQNQQRSMFQQPQQIRY